MKIIPAKGWLLVQVIAPDFELRGKLVIPRNKDKGGLFAGRVKVLAVGQVESETATTQEDWIKEGDVVVMGKMGLQMAVEGQLKKEDIWIEVLLVPRVGIVGKVEGDFAEDLEAGQLPENFDKKIDKLVIH